MGYQVLEHTADFKLRAWGSDLTELFNSLLQGIFANAKVVNKKESTANPLTIEATSLEDLVVDFLTEVVYLADVNDSSYLELNPQEISESKIAGKLTGYKVKSLDPEIKGVTYHDLVVKKTKEGYEATVLFDI